MTSPVVARDASARATGWHGIALLAASSLLYATMAGLAKVATRTVPLFELVLIRSLVTLSVMEMLRRRMAVPLVFHRPWLVVSRSVAGFVAICAYFYALAHIPMGDAVLLNNASPALTSVGAVWLLRERMTRAKALALPAAFAGVWMLVHHQTGPLELRGALVGAGSAVATAWALVSLKAASRHNRSVMLVWSLAVTCALGAGVLAPFDWIWPNPTEWALAVGVGMASSGAQLLMTSGYRRLDASEASIYTFLTPVLALVVGWTVFDDVPRPLTFLGGALIIGAGLSLAWSQRRQWA